jgi:hypothetical protein
MPTGLVAPLPNLDAPSAGSSSAPSISRQSNSTSVNGIVPEAQVAAPGPLPRFTSKGYCILEPHMLWISARALEANLHHAH